MTSFVVSMICSEFVDGTRYYTKKYNTDLLKQSKRKGKYNQCMILYKDRYRSNGDLKNGTTKTLKKELGEDERCKSKCSYKE
jgi:hypothetical protein